MAGSDLSSAAADPEPGRSVDPRLADAIRRLSRANALVVGDAMLDRYVYGDVDRVSREAPVPVLCVHRELSLPGGAGNVVRNLVALGAAAAFVSVVGDDQAGADLTGLVGGQQGVEPWLLVQGGRVTTTKTRFVAQGQQVLRADREETSPIHPRLSDRLLRIARDSMAATSITILSDYRKGLLAGDLPSRLVESAHQVGRRVIVDVRGTEFARYEGADVVVLGRRDLARATDRPVGDDAAAESAADALRRLHRFGAVVVMRAEHGMTLVTEDGAWHFRAEAAEVFDVSGSGDTAVATLAAALASGTDLPMAAELANIAAGVVVGKVGIAVAREGDLLAAISPQGGAKRKIASRDVAAERSERWRRSGLRIGFVRGAFDPLQPEHVLLLEQARGACDRLVVGLDGDALCARQPERDGVAAAPARMRADALARISEVDLIVISDDDSPEELLNALRPDVLVAGKSAADIVGADVVQTWGGRVLLPERMPEPAAD